VRHHRNQRFGVMRYSSRCLLRTVTLGLPGETVRMVMAIIRGVRACRMGIVRHHRNQRFGVMRYSSRCLLRTVTLGEPGAKWVMAA
ncbi:MAG: hypothetical protein ACP5O7_08240, partial [Phycisphaerae bacterium]